MELRTDVGEIALKDGILIVREVFHLVVAFRDVRKSDAGCGDRTTRGRRSPDPSEPRRATAKERLSLSEAATPDEGCTKKPEDHGVRELPGKCSGSSRSCTNISSGYLQSVEQTDGTAVPHHEHLAAGAVGGAEGDDIVR